MVKAPTGPNRDCHEGRHPAYEVRLRTEYGERFRLAAPRRVLALRRQVRPAYPRNSAPTLGRDHATARMAVLNSPKGRENASHCVGDSRPRIVGPWRIASSPQMEQSGIGDPKQICPAAAQKHHTALI